MQARKEGLKGSDHWNIKWKYWEGKAGKICTKYKLHQEVEWGRPEKGKSKGSKKVVVEEIECNAEGTQREDGI